MKKPVWICDVQNLILSQLFALDIHPKLSIKQTSLHCTIIADRISCPRWKLVPLPADGDSPFIKLG